MKPVAILGRHHATYDLIPFEDDSIELWAFNNPGTKFRRIDVLFQMHPPHGYENVDGHLEWLRSNKTIPVYMREQRDDIPMCRVYPFDEIFALTKNVLQGTSDLDPLKFFTSTVPTAIALAVLQNRPKILVYGIELKNKTEYWKQRDCFTFWIGFAAGRGIDLEIHCANDIFKKDLYFWPRNEGSRK